MSLISGMMDTIQRKLGRVSLPQLPRQCGMATAAAAALHHAAAYGFLDEVEAAVAAIASELGPDGLRLALDTRGPSRTIGFTPLVRACKGRHHFVMDVLLRSGASPNVRCGSEGVSAVHAAVQAVDPIGLAKLLACGGDASAVDGRGLTPVEVVLARCSSANAVACVRLLLAAGKQGEQELTRLHAVALRHQQAVIASLLSEEVGSGRAPKCVPLQCYTTDSVQGCSWLQGFAGLAAHGRCNRSQCWLR